MWKQSVVWGGTALISVAAAVFVGGTEGRASAIQQEIASRVVRFHVLANSDRVEDQQVKMRVKEELLRKIGELLQGTDSLEETKQILRDNTEYLETEAQKTLRELGSDDPVTVTFQNDRFPVKSYGDYTFPAGDYEALRVKIGNARGHNWWCMLYPSLCFEDAVNPVLTDGGEKLKTVLSDDAYDEILKTEDVKFTFKWKFWE